MSTKHTKGPIRVCGGSTPSYAGIHSQDGYIVFGMADREKMFEHGKLIRAPDYETQRANLTRIVECWNTHDGLVAERDRLREALEDSADFISAIADATTGAGRIDQDSIMRFGERMKTTAKKLAAKNRAALNR